MTAPNDPEFRVSYTGGGAPATRRDTLTAGGPLTLQAAHIAVPVLSLQYISDAGGGEFRVTQHFLEEHILGLLEWVAALLARDLTWVATASRFSRFFHAAFESGAWVSVRCANAREFLKMLRACVLSMNAADLQLVVADTVAYAAGITASYVDRLSPARLAGSSSPAEQIQQAVRAKSIFAMGYVAADRAAGTEYADIVELVLFAAGSAAGSDLSTASRGVQASGVIKWLGDTSPEKDGCAQLWTYMHHASQPDEIRRRQGAEAARYQSLFVTSWDAGVRFYGNVALAFPKPQPGAAIFELLRVLVNRTRMSASLTAPVVQSLDDLLKSALHCVDTASLRSASNDERNVKIGLHLAAARADSSESKQSEEATTLHANKDFTSFIAGLEAYEKLPFDAPGTLTYMVGHVHPAGLQYVVEGKASHPLFKSMKAVRTPKDADDAFNNYMKAALITVSDGKRYVAKGVATELINARHRASLTHWFEAFLG
jgi:hypothetical protein